MNSVNIILLLFVNSATILAKTIRTNDDSDVNNGENWSLQSDPTSRPQSLSSTPITELEAEENIIDLGQNDNQSTKAPNYDKPIETVVKPFVPMCSMDADKFNLKVSQLVEKFIPDVLKLRPVVRGAMAKVYLQDGKLMVNKDYKLTGQPLCTEMDDNTKKYDIMVTLNDLMGTFEWKIFNLFGYNFSESAILKVKSIVTEFIIEENSATEKTKLKDIKVGKIDGIDVKVNIPERITTLTFMKPMLEYVVSRITTIIANGSTDTIVKHAKQSLLDSIKEKTSINP